MKMEQHNIENQIKEKLNLHEIAPSQMAWDKLSDLITKNETKKAKPFVHWIFLAATIAISFVFVFYYFSQNTITIENIAEREINSHTKTKRPTVFEVIKPRVKEKDNIVYKPKIFIKKHKNALINTNLDLIAKNEIDANLKVDEVQQSQTQQLEKNNFEKEHISQDNTLVKASTNIIENVNNKITVNPESLLLQVNTELNLTFKEKVFKKIDQSYREIKVAIVARNIK
jgi:hypothetical protein